MIRLTSVELRRLIARRLTVIGVAAVLLITAFLLFATWRSSQPLTAAEQQQNQVIFDQIHKDWELHGEENQAQCEKDWAAQPDPKPKLEEMCNYTEPKLEDFGRPKAVFTEVIPDLLLGSSYLLAFAGFLIGASFLGAEFSSGAISNWLTFEPRRLRVYGSKLLALAVGMIPLAVVVLALVLGGTFLIIDQLGTTAGTTGKVWGDLTETAGRAVLLAAAAAALGGVVGSLLRHTAAAIGVAMGYVVLVEAVFGGFLTTAQPWLIRINFDAWVKHGTTYFVEKCQTSSDGGYYCEMVEKAVSFEHGAWYLAVITVLLLAAGAGAFYRRDVN